MPGFSRREFLQAGAQAGAAVAASGFWNRVSGKTENPLPSPLAQFDYGDVFITSGLPKRNYGTPMRC